MNAENRIAAAVSRPLGKFQDPDWTAKGESRATGPFNRLDTLWLNTGTLCNITCQACYIESSPTNDRLVYLTAAEATAFYDEIVDKRLGTREIGITGGEPFMNPDIVAIIEGALSRGFEVLVLSNAMQPMQRPRLKKELLRLKGVYAARLHLRISLDHHTMELHEKERGPRTWAKALEGIDWLARAGFQIAIAGRTCWGESEAAARESYAALFSASRSELHLLPEMNEAAEVPEITNACWGILKKRPEQIMCATSRMVVKRKGADRPTVVPCTLIPYQPAFDMGPTLTAAAVADGGMFDKGAVKLCHVHCAKFCVLGGGSCS